ncbi:MAG TPA: hypothetical protein ENK14_00695 [Caldithrix sp.]|nr:hypothetical protein [Caldithrix sp.]
MELAYLEQELKKRWQLPGEWQESRETLPAKDRLFLALVPDFDRAIKKIEDFSPTPRMRAINYWYSHWSVQGLRQILRQYNFLQTFGVDHGEKIGLWLSKTPFQIKPRIYPQRFAKTLRYTQLHKEELLYWLYRQDFALLPHPLPNTIYLMLYSENGEHWKLLAELQWLQGVIDEYLAQIDNRRFIRLYLNGQSVVSADVIWGVFKE